MTASEEYGIKLKVTKTETVLLTLTLNAGQKLDVKINDREKEFTETETEIPGKAVYCCELDVTEWVDYSVIFTADTDTEFVLKAEAKPEPAMEEPEEEITCGETEEGIPAEEVSATEEPAEEEAIEGDTAEEETTEEPAAEETSDEAIAGTEAAEETPAEESDDDPDQVMLENGYVKVMVIRENGTNLYPGKDADAEAVSSLNHGDVVWVKAAGGIWAEVYEEEDSSPLFLNLNNVMLLTGEVEYDIPIRKVRLTSTLDGLTEIAEGTEITITAEFSGFMEDEIAEITWQYRAENDEEGAFTDIEDAHGFTYSYFVSAENVHNEWRIILTLKS